MQHKSIVRRQESGARIGRVTVTGGYGIGAVATGESRHITAAAPRGIDYMPCENDSALLVPVGGTQVCAGVVCDTGGLEPGELRLRSAGGAVIELKNNGNIVLNGLVITAQGEIVRP